MFKNYCKTAWRNFQRLKIFSFVNIPRLSIGIICFCLLTLYAYNESGFDKLCENTNDSYRSYVWFSATNEYPAEDRVDCSGPTNATSAAMRKSLYNVVGIPTLSGTISRAPHFKIQNMSV
jgi:hypothetical protein